MLRPSKLFVSFHKLRHFFQGRISELVTVNNQSIVRHSFTQQQFQQFVSHFFHRPISNTPVQPQQTQAKLLKVLQQHFPVFKAFSSPVRASRQPALGLYTGQQSRTMMTGAPLWGYPKTFTKGPVRQFSTAKPASVFQNHSSTFARIFSPAAKIDVPSEFDKSTATIKPCVLKNQSETKENRFYHIFAPQNKGMQELTDIEEKNFDQQNTCASLTIQRPQIKAKLTLIQQDPISMYSPLHDKKKEKNRVLIQSEEDLVFAVNNEGILHLTLDLLQFLNLKDGIVDGQLIRNIELLHHQYQIHVHHVLNLLQRLNPYLDNGTMRAVIHHGELLIEFLSPPENKEDAIGRLETLGVLSRKECIKKPVDIDYFNDIQTFIDHIDTLIDSSPAFKK